MAVHRQLSVFLENKPGVLARLCQSFARQGINITALSVSDTVDHAVVRLLVSDPVSARNEMEQHGVLVVETEVLTVELADRPGAMAELAGKLAEANVNIEYAYGTVSVGARKSLLVLRVSNLAKARRVLKA
jgi:hypothetical protein